MSIMPSGSESNTTPPHVTPQDCERAEAALAAGNGIAVQLAASVAAALAKERARVLNDARAVIERETSAYPGASPAVTSGIWGGFDQWAVACIEGLDA